MAQQKMKPQRKKQLKKLARLMNRQNEIPIPVTDPLLWCFDMSMTDQEADRLIALGTDAHSLESVARVWGISVEEASPLLDTLCRKGLVWTRKEPGLPVVFVLASILVGWFELQLARAQENPQEQEFANRLNELFASWKQLNVLPLRAAGNLMMRLFSRPFQSVVPALDRQAATSLSTIVVNRDVPVTAGSVRPTASVYELIEENAAAGNLAVMHCFCRQWRKMVDEPCSFGVPVEACIVIGHFGRFVADYGFGREITKDEALDIVAKCQKKGAVHVVFHDRDDTALPQIAICNCCWDCCGVISSYNRGILPLHFTCYCHAKTDEMACTGCGICEKFCPSLAVKVKDKVAVVDAKLCIGCGQCAVRCPADAMSLIPGKRDVVLPFLKPNQVRVDM